MTDLQRPHDWVGQVAASAGLVVSADSLHALDCVARLTGLRRGFPRTLVYRAYARPKITAGSEGIHMHCKYGTWFERLAGDAFAGDGRCSRHLDAPVDQLPILVLLKFSVRANYV